MCPRTSWPLSSVTRNIVFGRASVISPSISIFSSFAMRGRRVASGLAALECRLAGPLGEEALHRPLQILGGEQLRELVGDDAVGLAHSPLAVGTNDPLRGRVRQRRPVGEA